MNRRIFTLCGLLAGLLLFAYSCKKDRPIDAPLAPTLSVGELHQTIWNGTLEYKNTDRRSYSVYLNFLSGSDVEVSVYDLKDPKHFYNVQIECSYLIVDRILTIKPQNNGDLDIPIYLNSWYLIRKEPSLLVFQANAGNPDREATMTLHKKL